jgi:hypothetical protein
LSVLTPTLHFPVAAAGFAEPRYLLPMAVLFAAVLGLAARGAGQRCGPAVGAAIGADGALVVSRGAMRVLGCFG